MTRSSLAQTINISYYVCTLDFRVQRKLWRGPIMKLNYSGSFFDSYEKKIFPVMLIMPIDNYTLLKCFTLRMAQE